MSSATQLGNLLAGFAPMVAAMLLTTGPMGWLPVRFLGPLPPASRPLR
ncbi:hypothetical protein AB4Y67_00515 [Arthrobacter sp. YAF17]